MDKIVPSFQKSLFDSSKKTIADIAELGIDSLLEEGLYKDLPVVSLLIGIKNTAQNLYDRNLLKQTLYFIKEFNNGTIDKENLEKYKKKISEDKSKAERELGRVLLILNNILDTQKSIILANFYRNYINERISWEDFCELSEVLRMLFIKDLEVLENISKNNISEKDQIELYPIERLNSLGLIRKNIVIWEQRGDIDFLSLTELGKKLISCKD